MVGAAAFFSSPWFFFLPDADGTLSTEGSLSGGVIAVACLALLARRRFPVGMCVVTAIPAAVLPTGAGDAAILIPAFGLYAVAVYRSRRAAWVAFSAVGLGILVASVLRRVAAGDSFESGLWSTVLTAVVLLVGVLAGTNTSERHRYLDEIVERSRRLAVERDQRARLAAVEERTRIAREMHDIVAHSLTVIVAVSEGMVVAPPDRARDAGRTVAATARAALGEMRAMLGVLRDGDAVMSPLSPLSPTEPAAVVAAAQTAGFPVVLHRSGDVSRVSRQVRFALGRVVQEGVTNAMRHAPNASRIDVRVHVDTDAIDVRVENDGVPIRPSPSIGGGFGLRGLHERVLSVGGSVSSSPAGRGTWVLRAILPSGPTDERGTP
ncbi:MAG: histidine kinase [Microbacterium enclense]